MNPLLDRLQPYPFEKLRALFAGTAPADQAAIRLSIGEPQHATPELVFKALQEGFSGLAQYPSTNGSDALRNTIARWLERRYGLPAIDAGSQVLPVNGSREALFSFAQAVLDPSRPAPLVACPNPFYQIYEGAAFLAGAQPVFLNQTQANGFGFDLDSLGADEWARVQLLYVCSPGNPTGRVLSLDEWRELFALSDRYGFTIASDECYSELYFDEARPTLGALQAAQQLGREGFPRLVVFSSLSKRSNVPGLRSGFVAGDAALLKKFLLYRTYHGCAMSPMVQVASIAAWSDEAHVLENRRQYAAKFASATPALQQALDVDLPDASFYLWARTPISDTEFARRLYAEENVTVLPGSYLAREAHGENPGAKRVRIALVANQAECDEGIARIVRFVRWLG
ncbi:MAG: succinyldiaminopimelate transaminase [Candidatus Dactylopiibacterium carminicum]|uniref:Succinyldiaminopimelate transaminase n=1 Tax=Candidatus Dactylopiibacterium carminicum TaxID=857335 RepID=A0A272EXW7_9RHOO|nr:succinyldiaminopimelate transaminase [Candidatus Dactylopiibacterium carminicum]KAF7600545.1 succinyldiaminopimelate transaminase [Candidatus Dactylopiibacterium carminicum]PAS94886.1 MAG: succinyldiaminopimelate transaminase [Candidatus Dactylopiibacterium carminicum]PAT00549.1 MAG: succinyldiaminopimelate transaminase [Candidatus Dactylopiibacterium carminicum]